MSKPSTKIEALKNLGIRRKMLDSVEKRTLRKMSNLLQKKPWEVSVYDIAYADYDDLFKKNSINNHFFIGVSSLINKINAELARYTSSALTLILSDLLKRSDSLFLPIGSDILISDDQATDLFIEDIIRDISNLNDQEKSIFMGRFGYGSKVVTLNALSDMTNKAPSRIRQKESEICEDLRCSNRIPGSLIARLLEEHDSCAGSDLFFSKLAAKFDNQTGYYRFLSIYLGGKKKTAACDPA